MAALGGGAGRYLVIYDISDLNTHRTSWTSRACTSAHAALVPSDTEMYPVVPRGGLSGI